MRVELPRLTFWRGVLIFILTAGLFSTVVRFTQGLGASTALSDKFPWGLWIGFDVLCGVALAAGGFTLSAVVYIFHIERFRPIVRPTILTAFLGYSLVIVGLFFDLGRGYKIYNPLTMWNPHSVMFEVAWCVMLYTTVLALEFSPILFERLNWQRPLSIVKSVMVPLVILGVVLSTLHQSSLGTLFLIVPGKLHPLWYSPLLPLFFFVSAVALGCAMTIFESFLSWRAFRRRLELDLLSDLGKVIVVALGVYLILRVQDLVHNGTWSLALGSGYEARMFQAEFLLGVLAPIVLLLIPAVRRNDLGLFASSVMVISGFLMNRLNVSITGLERAAGALYVPSWMEVAVTLSLTGIGFLLFSLAVRYLNIFPEEEEVPVQQELPLPAVAQLSRPAHSTTKAIMLAGVVVFLLALALATDGVLKRPGTGAAVVQPTTAVAHLGEIP
ncbi:MAG: Ni/Fe-hydrogenase cytochrome b subunit [Acidobacteriota bacterium]